MEIINGYIESMSLGTTVYNNITPETSSYNIASNNIYFFNGSYDTEVLYNVINEATLLSTYASQYLGKLTNVSLDFLYTDSKKQRVIKQPSPNALRFKDERYFRTNYVMGNSFTKPTESDNFKIKINGTATKTGYSVNGSPINMNVKKEYYNTYTDGFDLLFANGTSVSGGAIDLANNQLYGYNVMGASSTGYLSVPFSVLKDLGLTVIECTYNNTGSYKNGAPFVGYAWNNVLTQTVDVYSTKFTIDFVNMSVTNTNPTSTPSVVSLVGLDLSKIYIGIHAIQTGTGGWTTWTVNIPNESFYTYDLESDIFTSSTNISLTNSGSAGNNSIEILPLDANDQPIQRTIDWCAIKIKNDENGDYFIYTDEIGTRDNKSSINLYKKESVYGTENIVNSIKIDLRNKSVGEV